MSNHFLNELLTSFARQTTRPVLVYRGRTVSYGELDALTARCAAWLQGFGVQSGDRVALSTADKLAFLVTHLGTLRAGAVSQPLNPRLTRDELRYFLADSGAQVAVMGDEHRGITESLRGPAGIASSGA